MSGPSVYDREIVWTEPGLCDNNNEHLQQTRNKESELKMKEETNIKYESTQIQDVEVKQDIEIEKKPLAFKMKKLNPSTVQIHTDKKPYQCTPCDKTFSQNKHLEIHMGLHTRVLKQKLDHPNAKKKLYHCSQCGMDFKHNCRLISHLRTHICKKYQCRFCVKGFSFKNVFVRHLRTHTGQKPYKCKHCDKAFLNNHELIKHIKDTHGENILDNFLNKKSYYSLCEKTHWCGFLT